MKIRLLMWVLWPSFLAAGVAEIIVFSLIDPDDLIVLGHPVHVTREAVYSVGFFVLWLICAISSALTIIVLPGSLKHWREHFGEDLD